MAFLVQIPMSHVTSVIDGLKKLYVEKLKPLEVTYLFNDFVSSLLVSVTVPFLVFHYHPCSELDSSFYRLFYKNVACICSCRKRSRF